VRAAVAFLTPIGRSRPPGPTTLDWFPLVGAAIGFALGGWWWVCGKAWPPAVAAALVVAGDLAITGMLHFDGLVDSADGLLPPVDRDRRLAIMAAPDTGAFGVGAGGAVLLARWSALVALRPNVVLLAGLWCLSRTLMAVVARSQPYARPAGLASAFTSGVPGPASSQIGDRSGEPPASIRASLQARHWLPLIGGVALSALLLVWWRPGPGLAAAGVAILAAAGVALLARRRLGGYTGDVLGACGVLAETAGVVVAAARW
jgi:adenosylcobinamide-GDP ribazoletransferase